MFMHRGRALRSASGSRTKKFPSGQYFYNTIYRIRIKVYIEYYRVSVPSWELGPPILPPLDPKGEEEQLAGEEVGGIQF
jgi:hypothetical protein